MIRRILFAALLSLVAAVPAPAAAQAAVTITLACKPNPELTTVRNNSKATITITSIGTLYERRAEEPYRLGTKLAAGKSITYQSGPKAVAPRLTTKYIYNNDVGAKEGAQVVTSAGTFTKTC